MAQGKGRNVNRISKETVKLVKAVNFDVAMSVIYAQTSRYKQILTHDWLEDSSGAQDISQISRENLEVCSELAVPSEWQSWFTEGKNMNCFQSSGLLYIISWQCYSDGSLYEKMKKKTKKLQPCGLLKTSRTSTKLLEDTQTEHLIIE